ncbi:Uncharacterized protein ACO02O_09692 [Dirofilaria immitis]
MLHLIILIILLSFTKQIDSDPIVLSPLPARIFSGISSFNLSKQNQLSSIAHDLDRSLDMRSDNSTSFPSLQKSTSTAKEQPVTSISSRRSMKYRRQEEMWNKFYKAPQVADISTKVAIFHSFQDDNFDEHYQRINETYFWQGNNSEEQSIYEPYTEEYSTTELPVTTRSINRILLQKISSSSSLSTLPSLSSSLSLALKASTAIIFDVDASHDAKMESEIINRNIGDTDDSVRGSGVLSDDDYKDNNLESLDRHTTLQKRYSAIVTTPLIPKYWEMQRTDSGQSIIRVPTAASLLQITEDQFNIAHNKSIINEGNNDNNDLNFDDDQVEGFISLKKNPSLQSVTNQPTISVNSILTKDIPNSDDNLIITTSSNINKESLLPTDLTLNKNQKTQSTVAKIISTEDITDFDFLERTSTRSSNFMAITDVEDLTLNMKKTELSSENFPPSSETELSSFSTFHLKTSPPPLSLTIATTDAIVLTDDYLTKFPSSDKFQSNDGDEKIHLKSTNDEESEIINNRNFYQNETNLNSAMPQNVKFDEFDEQKIVIDPIHNQDEQRQAKNEQTFLSGSDSKSGSFELSSILGDQVDDSFNNLIQFEKQQLGISIPKYENSIKEIVFAQIPKQNGVNSVTLKTAGSSINRGISIRRRIIKGKILEKQKLFIGGKPVSLKLRNPIIYGHDWLRNPGSIIHGFLQPLQSEVYNIEKQIEKQKKRSQNAEIFVVRPFLNNTRMHERSKQKRKQIENKNAITDQTGQMGKLINACYGNKKDSNDSNNQENNILVIYIETNNNSFVNKLEDAEKNQYSKQCFYVINNCALINTVPFERRSGISLIECAQFCSSLPGCLSASYLTRFSICNTYHFKFGSNGKKLMKFPLHYYLELQPGCFIENQNSYQMEASKTIHNGKKWIAPKREGNNVRKNQKLSSTYHDNSLNYNKKKQDDCPDGENMVITKTSGWTVAKFNGRKREYFTTKIDCLKSCYRNMYKKNISYRCSSATFEHNSNRCNLYSIIHPANNSLKHDASTIYYEKNCFSKQIAELCDSALIERQPQHILITFPDAILTTSTLVKCLLKCFWSLQDGQTFQCHSLMYFYEQEVDNCILNSKSKRSHPNSLKKETTVAVDYFDLNECFNVPLMVI